MLRVECKAFHASSKPCTLCLAVLGVHAAGRAKWSVAKRSVTGGVPNWRSLWEPSRFVGSDQWSPVARPPGWDVCPVELAVIDALWGVRAGPVSVSERQYRGDVGYGGRATPRRSGATNFLFLYRY